MKRSLIAVALAVLSAVAVAEPSIDMSENAFRAVPETTSYQADVNVQKDELFTWNP